MYLVEAQELEIMTKEEHVNEWHFLSHCHSKRLERVCSWERRGHSGDVSQSLRK